MPQYNAEVSSLAQGASLGPLDRTVQEQIFLRRLAAFRKERASRVRRMVRESDLLITLVEECRLREWELVPSQLWVDVVRFVRRVDTGLRDALGINRKTRHVGDILFAAQEELFERIRVERSASGAVIIPLFRDPPARDTRTA